MAARGPPYFFAQFEAGNEISVAQCQHLAGTKRAATALISGDPPAMPGDNVRRSSAAFRLNHGLAVPLSTVIQSNKWSKNRLVIGSQIATRGRVFRVVNLRLDGAVPSSVNTEVSMETPREKTNPVEPSARPPLDYAIFGIPNPLAPVRAKDAAYFTDLEQFKVDLKAAGLEGAEEQLATVGVRRPLPASYFRVDPSKDMTISVALYESREGFTTEYYIVMPKMLGAMMDLRGAFFAQLYVTVDRSGAVALWPVKLPTGGAGNPWFESALRGAEMAKADWIRIFADPGQGQYRIMKALSPLGEPAFPEKTLSELLELAFKGKVIDAPDHPVCRRLRGEV
jgi:hypothetical protein